MRSTTKGLTTKGLLATLIIASTLTLGACQAQKQNKAEAEQPKVSQTTQNKATPVKATNQDETVTPDGWVVVDNETAIPVVDKLGKHLAQARQSYIKGDNENAAIAMREGSDFLKQEIPNVPKENRSALQKASDDLMKNASLVQMGEIDSVKKLDKIFTEAYNADAEQLWIVAEEQDWIPIVEMPQQHWQAAKKDFLNKDNKAAAKEIHKGIAFLNLEANRTTDQSIKSNLSNTVQNLEQLADNVKAGKVSDVKVLDRGFAGGQLAMGQFYDSQAKASESQGELVTAGNEIIAAFHQLQAANTWLGKDNANLQQAQAEINAVRDNLGSPNEALSRNLSPAIVTVGEQITNLNQNIARS